MWIYSADCNIFCTGDFKVHNLTFVVELSDKADILAAGLRFTQWAECMDLFLEEWFKNCGQKKAPLQWSTPVLKTTENVCSVGGRCLHEPQGRLIVLKSSVPRGVEKEAKGMGGGES